MSEQVEAPVTEDFAPNYARAFVGQDVKGLDEAARTVTHLISTGSVDRMGDVIEPKGVDLTNYLKNPLVLANHSYSIENVIGRATDIRITKDGIVATTHLRDTPMADVAFALAKEKLGGWSIGFRPMDSHSVREGARAGCKDCKARWAELAEGKQPGDYIPGGYARHFLGWEMLEYSSVAVPANQDVVNNAVRRGILPPELVDRFFVPSITPTPTVETVAALGPTAKAVEVLHPVLADALARTGKRFAFAAVNRGLRDALEEMSRK